MTVVLALKATTGSPFAPVTTANAFKGQETGSKMLVAEAPQAMGRTLTLAYSGEDVQHTPIAFGGFSTQSRIGAQPRGRQEVAVNQTEWDEDRVIDEPQQVALVTETSSITKQTAEPAAPRQAAEAREAPEAKKSPKARLAAAAYEDDAKPRKATKRIASDRDADKAESKKKIAKSDSDDTKAKKKVASNREDGDAKGKKVARKSDDEDGKSRRSRREVASYEERRSYKAERDYEYRSKYAQVERNYGSGGNSEGGRSAGQLTSDNLRPL